MIKHNTNFHISVGGILSHYHLSILQELVIDAGGSKLNQIPLDVFPGDVGRAPNFAIAEQNPGWVGLVNKEFTLGGK